MTRSLRIWFFAGALMFPCFAIASIILTQPVMAQAYDADRFAVSYQAFHDRLAPYGSWHETKRWGYVWQPGAVSPDFRPYYDGHWIYTDAYGWYWVSDEPWADIKSALDDFSRAWRVAHPGWRTARDRAEPEPRGDRQCP